MKTRIRFINPSSICAAAVVVALSLGAGATIANAQLLGQGDSGPPVVGGDPPNITNLVPVQPFGPAGPRAGQDGLPTEDSGPGGPAGGSGGRLSGGTAGGGGSSAGGAAAGGGGTSTAVLSASAKGAVDDLRARVKKVEDDLFKQLIARERARWVYEHGGGFDRDLAAFRHHDEQIRRLQKNRHEAVRQMLREIVKDKPEKRAAAEKAWKKFHGTAQKNFGLQADKYKNIIETDAPLDAKQRAKWLADRDYFAP